MSGVVTIRRPGNRAAIVRDLAPEKSAPRPCRSAGVRGPGSALARCPGRQGGWITSESTRCCRHPGNRVATVRDLAPEKSAPRPCRPAGVRGPGSALARCPGRQGDGLLRKAPVVAVIPEIAQRLSGISHLRSLHPGRADRQACEVPDQRWRAVGDDKGVALTLAFVHRHREAERRTRVIAGFQPHLTAVVFDDRLAQ